MSTRPILLALLTLAACNRDDTQDTHTHDFPEPGIADYDDDGFKADVDCDDTNAAVNPDAVEACDGLDNDCDGVVDGAGATGAQTFYLDADGDGFGVDTTTSTACAVPPGYAAEAGDCDDGSVTVAPGATEVCDGVDNDCDSQIDEPGAAGALPWYADTDDDGWGDAGSVTLACNQPAGFVLVPGDCDDDAQAVNPAAIEACNSIDDDCDRSVDEDAPTAPWWYLDADGDLQGNPAIVLPACAPPQGYVDNHEDCDDLDPNTYSGATELCDGKVNRCGNPLPADEQDADADGWATCAGDCDDGDLLAHPAMVEICDGVDNDCDTSTDEAGALGEVAWYDDTDGDDAGDPALVVLSCTAPPGHVADAGDCDPANGDVHPGATEVCNGVDDDCDGVLDDGTADATAWYLDADGDGWGLDDVRVTACAQPPGYEIVGGDCDDTSAAINPAAVDIPGDGVDDDCDGDDTRLTVFVASGTTGEVWKVDRQTGDPTLCKTLMDGPDPQPLVDIAAGNMGLVYVATPTDVLVLTEDCIDTPPLVTGLTDITGLFLDRASGDVLITERGGVVWEVDTRFGSPVMLAEMDPGPDLTHAVRRTGDPTLWLARGSELYTHDPADPDTFTVHHADATDLLRLLPAPDHSVDALAADALLVHPDNPYRRRQPAAAWSDSTVTPVPAGTTAACADVYGPGGVLAVHDGTLTAIDLASGAWTELNHVMTDVVGCATNALPDMDGDGFVAVAMGGDDCDDADPFVYPRDGAPRDMVGNGVDEDCDGIDGIDGDADGYASLETGGDDCNDANPAVFPGAVGCTAAPGVVCLDLLLDERIGADGSYAVDPTGDNAYPVICDMENGGWTLVGTNAHDGAWVGNCASPWFPEGCTVLDTSTFGQPSLSASYKGPAFNEVPFTDLRFVKHASDPLHYAVYEDVGTGLTSFQEWENTIPIHNCGTGTPYVWPMTEGTLGPQQVIAQHTLCSENLYMHPWDWDSTTCFMNPSANNAFGPAWSGFETANGSCPPGLDDPDATSFRTPGSGWGFGTPLSMYVR